MTAGGVPGVPTAPPSGLSIGAGKWHFVIPVYGLVLIAIAILYFWRGR